MHIRQMLVEPPLPEHLVDEDGLIYCRELVVRDERVPARFSASLLVEGPEGLSWNALVTGLEIDRSNMRARFENALETADARQRARLSTALSACYSGMFGFRRGGVLSPSPAQVTFDAWMVGLPIKPDRDRPAWDIGPRQHEAYMAERGCLLVPFSTEDGHVPVGHDLLLYLLAEVEPALTGADFGNVAHLNPNVEPFDVDDSDENLVLSYTLQAWCGSRVYEAGAHTDNDWYDTTSAVGFLNAILRDVATGNRFRVLGGDGEIMGYGPLESIRDVDDEGW